MEFLFKHLTPQKLALAVLAAAVLVSAIRHAPEVEERWLRWRYPPQRSAGPLGDEILKNLRSQEIKRVEAAHRRVAELLAAARAQGLEVSELEARAQVALALAGVDAKRAEALDLLNSVEMAIPRKTTDTLRPATREDDRLEKPPEIPSRRVVRKPRRRAS
jgi:hypothetical protein